MNLLSSRPLRRLVTAAAAVVALLMTGFLAPASAAPAPDPDRQGKQHHEVIEVIVADTEVVHSTIDPGSGPEPGDVLLIENTAYAHGKETGKALTRFEFFSEGRFMLDGTLWLKGRGELTASGAGNMDHVASGLDFAVTGGTGEFSHVSGHVTAQAIEYRGQEGAKLVFHLKHQDGHGKDQDGHGKDQNDHGKDQDDRGRDNHGRDGHGRGN
ncbi:hypothetical protein [Streptomyces sp. YIM 98790]|uniref:hypothetical protein n=1 Tax=Streptomyces sp. YIM 98790 TaxID=2689077 RepID=UPI001409544E|nr:hypothetical protein [Streptomyces sp. YIM 98790]